MDILKFDFKQVLEKEDTLELYIYSEVAPDGYSYWADEKQVSETSSDFFRGKLSEFKDVKNIILYINSAGGSVKEGYGIYAQLKRHGAYITAYVDGFANSIASIICMSADKVVMYRNSMMGIHNAMDWVFGNAKEHRKCADDLDSLMEGNRQIYLAKSNGKIKEDELIELLDAETMLNAKQCFEYGFCDEIADEDIDLEKATQMMQRTNLNLQGQVAYFGMLKQAFNSAMDVLSEEKNNLEEQEEIDKLDPEQDIPLNGMSLFFNNFKSRKE